MKTRILLSLLATFFMFNSVDAAPARRTNTRSTSASTTTTTPSTAARSARSARSATPTTNATGGTRTMSARSARPVATTAAKTTPTISARAGTTQKVINTGTNVSSAAKNTLVNQSCQEKYNGCMDAFCMLENSNGGRCTCSDKINDLNKALAEIERIDEQSYRMATIGIEQLEMGADADAAIAMAQDVTNKIKNPQAATQGRKLDFSAFETPVDFTEDIFKSSSSDPNSLDDKTGNDLYNAVSKLCKQQIPECESSIKTIELLYSQQIKSDCLAYENTIKKKRNESNEKLLAAERALREAALEQHNIMNKYDIDECTLKFKECMQTTGGCGEDFSGCATVVATDNTSARNNMLGKTKKYKIQGAVSAIEIAASTYDTLFAKKTLCEGVTKQCVAVADRVWDTFLRESAPQIKSAEVIAEDNARQNCISDISACFQKACRDNMDPNDPDGSYDMCLTRPETMLNVCRIPLNACGIDATKLSTAKKSEVWNSVMASLMAQRVDACTTQVKQCLQSSDRCGSDYSQCVGLDQETVLTMCPLERVTACNSSAYGDNPEKIQEYIYSVARGVFLNIDNSMQRTCQNAALSKMIEVCGDTTTCFLADTNDTLGTGSLQTTQDDDSNYIISGLIDFNKFKLTKKENPTADDYSKAQVYTINYSDTPDEKYGKSRVEGVIKDFQDEFNRKLSLFVNDPTINMCITGRDVSQIVRGRTRTERTAARYPEMLNSYIDAIYDSLLTTAKNNYLRQYSNELSTANSFSQEYRNMLMCYGLVDLTTAMSRKKDPFTPNTKSRYGIIAEEKGYIKLTGVSNDDILKLQQAGANDTTTHYDSNGLVIATEDISAVYEPGPQVCRLTSRLYACKGYEAIYEGHSKSTSVGLTGGVEMSGSAGILGGGVANAGGSIGASGGVSVGTSSSSTTHSGTFCNSFAEPLISEQIISFKSGEAVFGNVDRGNMESTYYNSSQTNTYTDNSWGIDASVSLSFDQSTHEENNGDKALELKAQQEKEAQQNEQNCENDRKNGLPVQWNGRVCVADPKVCKDQNKDYDNGKCVDKKKQLKKSDCTGNTPILDREKNECRARTAADCKKNEDFISGECLKKCGTNETRVGKTCKNTNQIIKDCEAKNGYRYNITTGVCESASTRQIRQNTFSTPIEPTYEGTNVGDGGVDTQELVDGDVLM